jgi:hypothetical protein
MRVEESIEINRPVEEVFSYAADPKHFPEWSGIILEVQQEAPGSLREAIGSRPSASSWAVGSRRPSRLRPTSPTDNTPTGAQGAPFRRNIHPPLRKRRGAAHA